MVRKFLFCLLLSLCNGCFTSEGIYHRVQKGETLDQLSRRYEVVVSKIIRYNPELKKRSLIVGDRLFFPVSLKKMRHPQRMFRNMSWPVDGKVSSFYGDRNDPRLERAVFLFFGSQEDFHDGIDIVAPKGTNIIAAYPGKVHGIGNEKDGYGRYVLIEHEEKFHTLYGHLRKILVKSGDIVNVGTVIGTLGNTGRTTTHHLHFEISYRDKSVNPLWYLRSQYH